MAIILNLIEKFVGKLKLEPNYYFEKPFTPKELLFILFYRGLQVLRGLCLHLKIVKAKGIIFSGKGVTIYHGYKISSGPNLIIEDNVYIEALSEDGIMLGRNVTIKKGAMIVCSGVIKDKGVGLKIGDFSAIGANNYIAAQGGIVIGDNVIIGPQVMIFSEDHIFSEVDKPIRLQGVLRKRITIEDDCWIGAGAIILKGVTIGHGSIIAAGSVISKDVEPFSVIAGVPGKMIKRRTINL